MIFTVKNPFYFQAIKLQSPMEMRLQSVVLLQLIFASRSFGSDELPCNFLDSIDISSGVKLSNDSIIYKGIEYLKDNYAKVNYTLDNEIKRINVAPHIRGCPCNIKSCIRLCCPYGSFVDYVSNDEYEQNITCRDHEAAKYFEIPHATPNMDKPQFSYVHRICKHHYFVETFNITEVKRSLLSKYFGI